MDLRRSFDHFEFTLMARLILLTASFVVDSMNYQDFNRSALIPAYILCIHNLWAVNSSLCRGLSCQGLACQELASNRPPATDSDPWFPTDICVQENFMPTKLSNQSHFRIFQHCGPTLDDRKLHQWPSHFQSTSQRGISKLFQKYRAFTLHQPLVASFLTTSPLKTFKLFRRLFGQIKLILALRHHFQPQFFAKTIRHIFKKWLDSNFQSFYWVGQICPKKGRFVCFVANLTAH